MSLRLRLVVIFAGGSLVTLLAATSFLYWALLREIKVRSINLLDGRIQEMAMLVINRPGDLAAMDQELLEENNSSSATAIWLRVYKGRQMVVQTSGMAAVLPPDGFLGTDLLPSQSNHFLLMEKSLGPWKIQGAMDIAEDERMIDLYRRSLLITLVLGTGTASLFGLWAVGKGLQPLRAITEATQGITVQRLQQRLDPGQAPEELIELVRALNGMLDRLDKGFERLTRFSADLAHELRTPITILMGETEVMLSRPRTVEEYQQVLESSLEEFERLSRLITHMLFLARAEDPAAAITPVPQSASGLVEEVRAFYEATAEEKGVHLETLASGTIHGDPGLLRQALANLVANALEATPAGGHVRVEAHGDEHRAELAVVDDGRGIPPEELNQVMDRFFRTTDALAVKSPGTGLGLAIVQSIAKLHGGEVHIASQGGTTVRVVFPV